MNNTIKQHVQVPHLANDDLEITPKDLLIYACIRRYMNKDSKKAFPSLDKIAKDAGASKPTISKSIKLLEKYNYLKCIKESGKKHNSYIINTNKCANFEMFSFEFLDNPNLTFSQKSYILASQQFMVKENDLGKISYTNKELGEYIHLPETTINRYNRELSKTEYLQVIKESYNKDINGNYKQIKYFNLPALGQALVCTAINHELRIATTEDKISKLENENISLKKDLEMLKRALFKQNEKELTL